MTSLSIIIVSFNTRKVTKRCLTSLRKNLSRYLLSYEVIIVDNASIDGSVNMLKEMEKTWDEMTLIKASRNLGFGRANNLGLAKAAGRYVLYLNSDAIVNDIDFADLTNLMERDEKIGAITVKVLLQNGQIDPASHRGFPTLWRSFTYFAGLEKLFFKIPFLRRIFGGYHLAHMNLDTIHEIEVPTGAFLFSRKDILDKIGGFNKVYFAYGEDVEMAFEIKKLGYKIIYYPLWEVLHLKSVSGLKKKDKKIRSKTREYFYESMKIFYQRHYAKNHNWLVNHLVYLAINLKKNFFQ